MTLKEKIFHHYRFLQKELKTSAGYFFVTAIRPLYFIAICYIYSCFIPSVYERKIIGNRLYKNKYSKKIKELKSRYKRLALKRDFVRGSKTNIQISYESLSYKILVVTCSIMIANQVMLFNESKIEINNKIELYSAVIDRSLFAIIDSVDSHLNYLGEKVLLFTSNQSTHKDKIVEVAKVIKRIEARNFNDKNVTSWLDVGFLDNYRNLVEENKNNLLANSILKINYPIDLSLKSRWLLNIGDLQIIQGKLAKYQFLPVAMTIDNDSLKIFGTLLSLINIHRLKKHINDSFNDEDICYFVINANRNIIANSDNLDVFSQDLSAISNIATILDGKISERSGTLKKGFLVNSCQIKKHISNEYGLYLFVGYNRSTVFPEFFGQIKTLTIQSALIFIFFVFVLASFRNKKIVPFANEMIANRQAAERNNLAQRQFLSNMSHELRTPMNGIMGMIQILKGSTNLSPEELEQIKTIDRSSESLLETLNDILNISKIEERKITLESIKFSLQDLLEDVIRLMSTNIYKKNLEVSYYIEPDANQIFLGDVTRIRQIVTNLISNSIKFTNYGQIIIEVRLNNVEKRIYNLSFVVKDSGIGIDKEKLAIIFQQFTQADISTSRKYGGTGLGLAISKELIELMGGEIRVDSKVGEGSSFIFNIRIKRVQQKTISVVLSEKQSRLRIAIVDSNQVMANNLLKKLKDLKLNCDSFYFPSNFSELKQDRLISKINNFFKEERLQDFLAEPPCNQKDEEVSVIQSIFISHDNDKDKSYYTKLISNLRNSLGNKVFIVLMVDDHHKSKLDSESLKIFDFVLKKPIEQKNLLVAICAITKEDVNKIFDYDSIDKWELEILDGNQEKKELPKLVVNGNFDNHDSFSGKPRVLICEDNEVNIKVMKVIFSKMGFDVDVAENGWEAINRFIAVDYKIILMDCMMPIMDGLKAAYNIRLIEKEQKRPNSLIIATTANVAETDKKKCFESGMNGFISKPVHREELERMIAELCIKRENLDNNISKK